jgi:hypothetical protein
MTFKEWVIDLFKDERGSISVKPVIALLGTLALAVVLVGKITVADNAINAVMILTIAAIGGDTADKFTKKIKPNE